MFELLRSPRRLLLFAFEGVLTAMLVLVASVLRHGVHEGLTRPHILSKAFLIALVLQLSAYYAGLYELTLPRAPRIVTARVLQGLAIGAVALWMLCYVAKSIDPGRSTLLFSIALVAVVIPLFRALYARVSTNAGLLRRTLLVGNGSLAHEIAALVEEGHDLGLELVGMLSRDKNQVDPESSVVGTYDDLTTIVDKEQVDLVIVAYPDRRGNMPVEKLLETKFRGVEVCEGVSFYEKLTGKIFVRELKPSHLIFSDGFTVKRARQRVKRLLDIAISLVGLVLAAPLIVLTAIAIKLDSRGPVLYSQTRAGELGKLFTIHKFRSMRTDAELKGAQFAKENDDRVTAVGRFIRKTRLDELPQLWNVLRGDMSMVGPRPERPVFLERLEHEVPFFKQRLYVKPGVTGHAQVRCRYGASSEDMLEKLQYDLYYIKSQSLAFDLSIIVDTVKVVLFRIGAR